MKPLDSWRPEPGPSARESWSLAISLAMVVIGCVLGLDVFHERGAIGDELHLAALIRDCRATWGNHCRCAGTPGLYAGTQGHRSGGSPISYP